MRCFFCYTQTREMITLLYKRPCRERKWCSMRNYKCKRIIAYLNSNYTLRMACVCINKWSASTHNRRSLDYYYHRRTALKIGCNSQLDEFHIFFRSHWLTDTHALPTDISHISNDVFFRNFSLSILKAKFHKLMHKMRLTQLYTRCASLNNANFSKFNYSTIF